jgi:hypothetical protein
MNIRFPKTMNELYTLADKCARTEEGRRLPSEEDGVDVDSEDDDDTTNQKKKNKKRNKKSKDKAVLAVEGLSTPSTAKKAKTEAPGKEAPACTDCREATAAEKVGRLTDRTARSIGLRDTIFKSVIKLSSSSRSRKLSMRSVTKRETKMVLAGRAEVAEEVTPARPLGIKGNQPEAVRRRNVMMGLMKEMKRKPASRSSRRPLTPCALTGVRPYTPLTANSSGGRMRLMSWNQRQGPGNQSNGHARPSFLAKRIISTSPPR